MELSALAGEVHRVQFTDAGMLGLVDKVDALVDGTAIDLAELVVDMRTQRANAVGAESDGLGGLLIEGLIVMYTVQHLFILAPFLTYDPQ